MSEMKSRKRRLWWAKWQRLRRCEFWPVWTVYPPVLVSWVYHALRLRGATLWAGCNPGMKGSGLAMENKGGILDSFEGGNGRVRIAEYLRVGVDEEDRLRKIREWSSESIGRSFPGPRKG